MAAIIMAEVAEVGLVSPCFYLAEVRRKLAEVGGTMLTKSLKLLGGSWRKLAGGSSPIPPSDFRSLGSGDVAGLKRAFNRA